MAEEQNEKIYTQEEMGNIEGREWEVQNEKRNSYYLNVFEQDLIAAGLKPKTIGRHIGNVDTFLDMLAFREGFTMEECLEHPGLYLGEWYIRRCMWSAPANIKTTAASIKKFGKYMADHGFINPNTYADLVLEIKEDMEEWQADCARYNSGDLDSYFGFF